MGNSFLVSGRVGGGVASLALDWTPGWVREWCSEVRGWCSWAHEGSLLSWSITTGTSRDLKTILWIFLDLFCPVDLFSSPVQSTLHSYNFSVLVDVLSNVLLSWPVLCHVRSKQFYSKIKKKIFNENEFSYASVLSLLPERVVWCSPNLSVPSSSVLLPRLLFILLLLFTSPPSILLPYNE